MPTWSEENPLEGIMSSLAVPHPLERTVSVAQKLVKIQFILPNIPLDVHELADEDSPVLDSELAALSGC